MPHKVFVTVRGARRRSKGLVIRFSLNRRAGVLIYVVRLLPHHKYRTVAVLSRKARAGTTRMRYNLRSRRRLLAAGQFEIVAIALNNGASSRPRTVRFRVALKRLKRHR